MNRPQLSSHRSAVMLLIGALLGTAMLAPATLAAAAEPELITATPEIQTVVMPAPGGSELLRSTVTNTHDEPVVVQAQLLSDSNEPIISADGPLLITFSVDGESVGETLPFTTALETPIAVRTIAPGASSVIEATVSMDRSAGNEWAGKSTAAVLQYTAQADDQAAEKKPSRESLAFTGTVGIGIILIVALVAVAMGIAMLGRTRRPAGPAGSTASEDSHEEESR